MEKLFPGIENKKVIQDNLLGMCYGTDVMVYQKPLEDDELTKLEKEYIQSSIKFAKLKDDLDKIKEEFKSKMKPVEMLQKERIGILKTGTIQKEGTVYLIDDQENRVMNIYDEEGNFISSRPLLPAEKQLSITREIVNG